jgi:hypothetical protein
MKVISFMRCSFIADKDQPIHLSASLISQMIDNACAKVKECGIHLLCILKSEHIHIIKYVGKPYYIHSITMSQIWFIIRLYIVDFSNTTRLFIYYSSINLLTIIFQVTTCNKKFSICSKTYYSTTIQY